MRQARNVVTIREAVQRAKDNGLPVSEYALRMWVKTGEIPHKIAGRSKILIYWPTLERYLRCEDINQKGPATGLAKADISWLRRTEVN